MEGNGSGKRYFEDEDYTLVFDNEIANAPITASPGDIMKVMISDITKFPKKPWNDRGADLSDYFNYNFDENTWSQYSKVLRDYIENYGACGDALHAPLQGYNEGIPNVFGFSLERTLSDIDDGTFKEKPWLTPRVDSLYSNYSDYSSTSSNLRKKREHESLENGNMVPERSQK